MYSFDSFGLPKRSHFCLKNTAKLEPVGNFSDKYIDVAIARYLSETAVLCILHGCVSAGLAPFPAFTAQADSQQALWEAVSNARCLECQLCRAFMEVPHGTGHS